MQIGKIKTLSQDSVTLRAPRSVASVTVVPAVFPRGNLRDIPAGEKTGREAPGLTNYVAICWLDTDLMRTKGVNRDAN